MNAKKTLLCLAIIASLVSVTSVTPARYLGTQYTLSTPISIVSPDCASFRNDKAIKQMLKAGSLST
jgi:hypothetical protein